MAAVGMTGAGGAKETATTEAAGGAVSMNEAATRDAAVAKETAAAAGGAVSTNEAAPRYRGGERDGRA